MKKQTSKMTIKRRMMAIAKRQKLYNPEVFLSPKRIDIAAKTIFARAYIEGNVSIWPEMVYREHIRAFNNFYEKSPAKKNYDDFKNGFIKTIDSVRNNDNWKHIAPVFRSEEYLVNGAHRVAASIVLNDQINTIIPKDIYKDNYNYDFFKKNKNNIPGIDDSILDYITIEYVSLKKKNIFVAVIFPTAEGFRNEAYEHLLKLGEIVNMKTFRHDEFIGKEVVKQLYFNSNNDEWNYGLDFDSAKDKADLCFDGLGDLQVYIIEANLDETTRIKEKKYLRNLWNKDKHSIHVTDTQEEANRLVRMFFNDNSRKFMQIEREQEFNSQKMYDMFNEYIKLAPKDILERERIAIEGSAVLDLLGIRDAKDIDYISRDETVNFFSSDIEKHNQEENSYHSHNIDEILTNPKYYFYYKGYKFIDIIEIEKYKKNRNFDKNTKDTNDLKLIGGFLSRNSQYTTLPAKNTKELPLVSIIVPVYNTIDEYLSKCLKSIQDQQYPNLEVIIVDDGSTKEIAKLIDDYVAGFKRQSKKIRWIVVHQKNRGLSGARNSGYKVAQGKYIQFLDSDDYFDNRLIQYAVDEAEATQADIVVENFIVKDYISGEEKIVLRKEQFPRKDTFTLKDLPGSKIETIPYNVWSKLFKKDFLDEHRILHDEDLKRCEDALFTYSALLRAQKIATLLEPYIYYHENIPDSNSVSNDKFPAMSIDAWRKMRDLIKQIGMYDELKTDYEIGMLGSLYWHYERLHTERGKRLLAESAQDFFKETKVTTKHIFREVVKLILECPELYRVFAENNNRIDNLTTELKSARDQINVMRISIAQLEQPSVKKASRKLAGATRRKIVRSINSHR